MALVQLGNCGKCDYHTAANIFALNSESTSIPKNALSDMRLSVPKLSGKEILDRKVSVQLARGLTVSRYCTSFRLIV